MIKKILVTLFFCGFLFSCSVCLAQDPLQNIAENSGYSISVTQYSLSETIGGYIKAILGMLGVIFFVLTFYAGFLWMTASGDEGKIEKAKEIITASTIGLVIIIMSYGLTSLVINSINKNSSPQNKVGN